MAKNKSKASAENGGSRSQQRRVMPRRNPNLSDSTIEKIGNKLHMHIQFYDSAGNKTNAGVIAEIEACLRGELDEA